MCCVCLYQTFVGQVSTCWFSFQISTKEHKRFQIALKSNSQAQLLQLKRTKQVGEDHHLPEQSYVFLVGANII